MRVSLRWLEEFVDLRTRDEAELTEAFSSLGMQVEGVSRRDVAFAGIVVGRVAGVVPHPDAGRLRLCSVDVGSRIDDIVCGAWNFEAGALVPVAVPGSALADGTPVGVRTIRGVTSHGMICSPNELGLWDDAEDILVLDDAFSVGDDFAARLPFPDTVFELEIEANRADEMSMLGVARELAAYFDVDYHLPNIGIDASGPPTDSAIVIEDRQGCGRFVAIPVDGIEVGPSSLLVRLRLQAAGLRPINNVVDVTNYVMLEMGQPLHAFDQERIDGPLVVRRAAPGERLTTLDGVDRALSPEDLVIADSGGVSSLAGIMGGESSEVRPSTSRVLLEAAYWDPPTIMGGSTRHGLRTEASSRFSKGVDPNLPPLAARRAAQLLASDGRVRISETIIDEVTQTIEPWTIQLAVSELRRLLGVEVDGRTAARLLSRLGMDVVPGDPLTVTVPTWRPDLSRPVDLVEEVARLYGYNSFPETLPRGTGGGLTDEQARTGLLREVMIGAGFTEAITLPFVSQFDLERLSLPTSDQRQGAVAMKNPISQQEAFLRTTVLPKLLEVAARNLAGGARDVALFETGRVFLSRPDEHDGRVPAQPQVLAFVAAGSVGPRVLGSGLRPVDVYTATGLWSVLAQAMGVEAASVRAAEVSGLHPGRAGVALIEEREVGFVGELHPGAARSFDLPGRVAVGELQLHPLVTNPGTRTFREPSPFPPVVFDLAFEVPEDLPSVQLVDQVRAADPMVESVHVFDEWTGDPLAAGRKSLAVHVLLRAPDRTLSQDDERDIRRRIAASVTAELGAKLRGEA